MKQEYTIVNFLHSGKDLKKVENMDDMSQERKGEIAMLLNRQAMRAIGYRLKEKKSI